MLTIPDNAYISPLADIEDSVRGSRIIIEDGATIDSFVKIKPAGGNGDVHIGKNCYINLGVVIYSGNGAVIGENVFIAANYTITSVNHQYKSKTQKIAEQGFQANRGGIKIEDDVWIGANVVILDELILHAGCAVGANTLVNRERDAY